MLDLDGIRVGPGLRDCREDRPAGYFLLVGGAFADRLLRRGVMLTADVARMAVQAATAALLLSHTAHLGTDGAPGVGRNSDGVFNPASTGLTPVTVSAERLQVGVCPARDVDGADAVRRPGARGILIVTVGPRGALAVDAVSFAVSAFYLARLHLPLHVSLPPQSFARDLLDGWRDFIARTWDWLIVVSASLGNMTSSVWLVLAAAWIKNGHGGAGAWRVILVVSAIGGLAAGATALRLKPRRPALLASIA